MPSMENDAADVDFLSTEVVLVEPDIFLWACTLVDITILLHVDARPVDRQESCSCTNGLEPRDALMAE